MLYTRFTGFLLGLFFGLHALKNCSVHAHQGRETIGERHVASEETVVSVQKDFLDVFGGRKMGGHEVGVASKNSGGNYIDAEIMSTGKFQDQANNQVIGSMNKLGPKTRDFAGLRIPRSGPPFHLPNSMQFEESKAKASLESHSSRSHDKPMSTEEHLAIGNTVESKRLLQAAKEIVNLIHKDYKGWDRPRRKPPINNHVPRH